MTGRTWRPSAPLVIAMVALVVAVSGGGQAIADGAAAAAKLITGKQVKNGSLTLADFKASERAKLRGAAGPAGPAGPKGDTGATGATGAAGAAGTARAYALVSDAGTLTAAKSKGVVAVTRPQTGVYCVKLDAAIDASTVEAVATLNFSARVRVRRFRWTPAATAARA